MAVCTLAAAALLLAVPSSVVSPGDAVTVAHRNPRERIPVLAPNSAG
jgi:hypothetical protein